MGFADLLEHVGGLGRFQLVSVLLLALPVLMMASHNLLQNFTAAEADHRCRLWWEVNATDPHHPPPWDLLDPHNLLHPFKELLQPSKQPLEQPKGPLEHPKDPQEHREDPQEHPKAPQEHPEDPLKHPKGPLDPPQAPPFPPPELLRVWVPPGERCRRFVRPQWGVLGVNGSEANGTRAQTEPCGDGWSYDRSVFSSTIVTEWDLVCSSRGLKQLAQSLYMAGVLVGGIVFGGLSDRFGRRAVLGWCYLQLGAMGTAASLAPSFGSYCLLRLLSGAAFSGVVLNSASLSLEWMPTRARALVGTLLGYCYTLGQFLLAGLAYALPRWRWLQLAVSLPFFLFFLYSWYLTESARWLVLAGRPQQALRALQKVARANGRQEEGDKLDLEVLRSYMEKELSTPRAPHTVLDLVRTPVVRRISCCLCFVWFSTSFAYYGLAMDLQNFDFNLYVLQLVFGAVDIPAKLVSILTITFVGRRFTQALALILAGLAILANVLVPRDLRVLCTALAVFGKGCLAASFNCVFLYTGELYPTVIRQTGMGLANTLARLGSITAPLVKMGGEGLPLLPPLIYGAAPVVAGVAAAFLPETRDRALPETVEEVEGRSKAQQDEAPQLPLQPHPPGGTPGPG